MSPRTRPEPNAKCWSNSRSGWIPVPNRSSSPVLSISLDPFDVVTPAREHLASISCPLLVIAGAHDPAAAMGAHATTLTQALLAAGVAPDLRLYEDARHELLNETNRDQVTADIINWLRSHQS